MLRAKLFGACLAECDIAPKKPATSAPVLRLGIPNMEETYPTSGDEVMPSQVPVGVSEDFTE